MLTRTAQARRYALFRRNAAPLVEGHTMTAPRHDAREGATPQPGTRSEPAPSESQTTDIAGNPLNVDDSPDAPENPEMAPQDGRAGSRMAPEPGDTSQSTDQAGNPTNWDASPDFPEGPPNNGGGGPPMRDANAAPSDPLYRWEDDPRNPASPAYDPNR